MDTKLADLFLPFVDPQCMESLQGFCVKSTNKLSKSMFKLTHKELHKRNAPPVYVYASMLIALLQIVKMLLTVMREDDALVGGAMRDHIKEMVSKW